MRPPRSSLTSLQEGAGNEMRDQRKSRDLRRAHDLARERQEEKAMLADVLGEEGASGK